MVNALRIVMVQPLTQLFRIYQLVHLRLLNVKPRVKTEELIVPLTRCLVQLVNFSTLVHWQLKETVSSPLDAATQIRIFTSVNASTF